MLKMEIWKIDCQNDDIYNYQYSGECLIKCPNDTIFNNYKCEVQNTHLCSLSIFQLNLTFNSYNLYLRISEK